MKFPIKIGRINNKICDKNILPHGNIYLEKGNDKFGFTHIAIRRKKEFEKENTNPIDFAKLILNNFNKVYVDKSEIIFAIDNVKYSKVLIISLKIKKGDNFYTIITEGWRTRNQLKEKSILFIRDADS